MAGSNVPTINSLLDKYHIAFSSEKVVSGEIILDKRTV